MNIREIIENDVEPLSLLLNEIIAIGGTTAFETPLSLVEFRTYYLPGSPEYVSCMVATNKFGQVTGFQSLTRYGKLPEGCADIATFVSVNAVGSGIGTQLFLSTTTFAISAGFRSINATIRTDNKSGLTYYTKMGFIDHSVSLAVPLNDGTPVDRISKRFDLTGPVN